MINDIVRKVDKKLRKAPFCRGVISENRRECRIPKGFWETLSESLSCSSIITQSRTRIDVSELKHWYRGRPRLEYTIPKKTADDMLQKSRGLLLNKLVDHVAQDGANGVKTFVCCAYVVEAIVVE